MALSKYGFFHQIKFVLDILIRDLIVNLSPRPRASGRAPSSTWASAAGSPWLSRWRRWSCPSSQQPDRSSAGSRCAGELQIMEAGKKHWFYCFCFLGNSRCVSQKSTSASPKYTRRVSNVSKRFFLLLLLQPPPKGANFAPLVLGKRKKGRFISGFFSRLFFLFFFGVCNPHPAAAAAKKRKKEEEQATSKPRNFILSLTLSHFSAIWMSNARKKRTINHTKQPEFPSFPPQEKRRRNHFQP